MAATKAAAESAAQQELEAGKVVAEYAPSEWGKKHVIYLQRRDISSLEPGAWLTDSIVDFGIQHMLQIELENNTGRIYTFSVLFSIRLHQVLEPGPILYST
jgi:Ulp1 family protease